MVKRGNTASTQFLVLWKNLPLTEATWEDAEEFGWRFPQFHLEDKVDFMEGALSRTEGGEGTNEQGGNRSGRASCRERVLMSV